MLLLALPGALVAARPSQPGLDLEGHFVDIRSVGGRCSDKRAPGQTRVPTKPWCHLTRALRAAPPRSVVYVRRGEYPNLDLGQLRRRTRVTVRGYPGEPVAVGAIKGEHAQNVRVEGLRITGGVEIGPGARKVALVRNRLSRGIVVQEGSRSVRIDRNRITAPRGSGVFLSSGPGESSIRNVRIRGNHFDNIGVSGVNARAFRNVVIEYNEFEGVHRHDGVVHPDVIRTYAGGSGLVVRGNFIHDNKAIGFFIKDGTVSNVTLENNVIVRTTEGFYAIQIYDVNGLRMVNNTVVDNSGGVFFAGKATGVDIRNNILESLHYPTTTKLVYEDYNYIPPGRSQSRGPHNIHRGILFKNVAGRDYAPAPGSTAIDAGTSDGAPTTDAHNAQRTDIQGVANTGAGAQPFIDLGALEFRPPPIGTIKPFRLKVRVVGRRRVTLRRLRRGLVVRVRCSTRCRLVMRARAKRRGRVVARSQRVKKRLGAGRAVKVRVRFGRKQRVRTARALRRRGRVRVVVTVLGKDQSTGARDRARARVLIR